MHFLFILNFVLIFHNEQKYEICHAIRATDSANIPILN